MLVDRFSFNSGSKKYVVNFTPILVKNYNQHRGRKEATRRGWLAVIRAKDTGVPYSGVALLSPSEPKANVNISDAKLLALRKAVFQLVSMTNKRGEEYKTRLRVHDIYTDGSLEFFKNNGTSGSKYVALKEKRDREISARKVALEKMVKSGRMLGKTVSVRFEAIPF